MKKLVFTAILGMFAFAGFAQTEPPVSVPTPMDSVSHNVKLTLAEVLEVQLASNVNGNFNFNTAAKMENGIEKADIASVQVRGNIGWELYIKAKTANTNLDNFFYTGSSTTANEMPLNVFQYKGGLIEAYQGITKTNVKIASGSAGDFESNTTLMSYKATPGFSYAPGEYTASVWYTVSKP